MDVEGGGSHSLALKDDGTVRAWGYNEDGQLGDGTTTDRHTPVRVKGISDVTDVAAGYSHSLAVSTMPLDTPLPINYIYCELDQAGCAGTQGKDDLYGTYYEDTIRAGSGGDRIYAMDGNDVTYGGDGNDVIGGSYGSDRLYGGNGRDVINTGGGRGGDKFSDYVNCGAGQDTVYRERRDTVKNCEVARNLTSGGGGGGGY